MYACIVLYKEQKGSLHPSYKLCVKFHNATLSQADGNMYIFLLRARFRHINGIAQNDNFRIQCCNTKLKCWCQMFAHI